MLTCLDLFSGIGGFALGFDRAGITTTKFCEIDPYARRVLTKHWPTTPIHDDVRTLHGTTGEFDIICGGFPCQDISFAGAGAGLAGARSGLWWEYHRIIQEVRPRWVVAENVSALRSRGLDEVLRSLAEIGYDAEWHCIPANAIGAPHRRDRIWITAYCNPDCNGEPGVPIHDEALGLPGDDGVAYPNGQLGDERGSMHPTEGPARRDADRAPVVCHVANPSLTRLPVPQREALLGAGWRDQGGAAPGGGWWAVEPNVGRVAHGVPKRVDRLRCLGNAVVPQIPEIIGRAILAVEAQRHQAAA